MPGPAAAGASAVRGSSFFEGGHRVAEKSTVEIQDNKRRDYFSCVATAMRRSLALDVQGVTVKKILVHRAKQQEFIWSRRSLEKFLLQL